jgi:hypothetical protein
LTTLGILEGRDLQEAFGTFEHFRDASRPRAPRGVHEALTPHGQRERTHAFRMNTRAKSFALRCALSRLVISSILAITLSTPSRYARRNMREPCVRTRRELGSIARDMLCRIRVWNLPASYLFLRRKFCFILPKSYSIPSPRQLAVAFASQPREDDAFEFKDDEFATHSIHHWTENIERIGAYLHAARIILKISARMQHLAGLTACMT